jgi:hypothetical protein
MKGGVSNGKRLIFESKIRVTFQNVFFLETHQNNIFLFLKNYFSYEHKSKKYKKLFFLKKITQLLNWG